MFMNSNPYHTETRQIDHQKIRYEKFLVSRINFLKYLVKRDSQPYVLFLTAGKYDFPLRLEKGYR